MRARAKSRGGSSEGDGSEPAGRNGDSSFPPGSPASPPVPGEGPPGASRSPSLSNRPEPPAREEVPPRPLGSGDLFGESCQKLLNAPVGPLEEHLGDQIIRGGVSVLSYELVCELHLTPSVDVEDSERNAQALRQPLAVLYRQRNAMRAPLCQYDSKPAGFGRSPGARHSYRHLPPRTLLPPSFDTIAAPPSPVSYSRIDGPTLAEFCADTGRT